MSEQNTSTPATPAATSTPPEGTAFQIEKIYLKDALFEQPNSPRIFLNQDNKVMGYSIGYSGERSVEKELQKILPIRNHS